MLPGCNCIDWLKKVDSCKNFRFFLDLYHIYHPEYYDILTICLTNQPVSGWTTVAIVAQQSSASLKKR